MTGTTLTIACVQNNPGPDIEANLEPAEDSIRRAAAEGAQLVSLPEYFSGLDVDEKGRFIAHAYEESEHPALPRIRGLAAELKLMINIGSLPIRAEGGKAYNRGYMIGPEGAVLARYDKLHLFDVELAGGETYIESETIEPGRQAVLLDSPWGPIGLSICYDLRFPQLYRRLAQAGARLLLVPAAFTQTTGEAHWHVLLRARAIECGAFVAAASQCGHHPGGAACYGHSLIVDPWGQVLADGGEKVGLAMAEIDLSAADEARAMIPALRGDRAFELLDLTGSSQPGERLAQAR